MSVFLPPSFHKPTPIKHHPGHFIEMYHMNMTNDFHVAKYGTHVSVLAIIITISYEKLSSVVFHNTHFLSFFHVSIFFISLHFMFILTSYFSFFSLYWWCLILSLGPSFTGWEPSLKYVHLHPYIHVSPLSHPTQFLYSAYDC